jgi:hypothetical protein
LLGKPSVKYRNGPTWKARADKVLHLPQVKQKVCAAASCAGQSVKKSHTALHAAVIDGKQVVCSVTQPVCQVLQTLPLGKAMFAPKTPEQKPEYRVAEHYRQAAIRRATAQPWDAPLTRPTNR